jgi:membrane protease subunit HflC
MSHKIGLKVGLPFSLIMLAMLVFFQVDVTEYVIITEFGAPKRVISEGGLFAKLPDPIQSVIRLDRRMQLFNATETEYLTKDKKNILVQPYAIWSVSDPLLFYKSVKTQEGANLRLADILTSEMGALLGRYELSELVTTQTERTMLSNLNKEATRLVADKVAAYGYSVKDIRLKMINFPEANRKSVFQRMRAERQQIARQLRSEGTEEATKIRAAADAEKTTILSASAREAEKIRGNGEAEAIKIYAAAYGKDPQFYKYLRSLESYEKIITDGTTLILPSDSELLKYINAKENTLR